MPTFEELVAKASEEMKPVSRHDIRNSGQVMALLSHEYTDRIGAIRVSISKAKALEILKLAGERPPRARWEDRTLILIPSAHDF